VKTRLQIFAAFHRINLVCRYVEARGALLASAEGILRGLVAAAEAAVAAAAAAEQERVTAHKETRAAVGSCTSWNPVGPFA
jgi:hypothetical protein